MRLIIGNRNYSSWSLRAWLYMRLAGLHFDVERIALFTDAWQKRIGQMSPTGRVPVLEHGDIQVWDSLAIIDYLHEHATQTPGWPSERRDRATAKAMVAEMHSGFLALRGELPQNLVRREALDPGTLSEPCRLDIKRINALWREQREAHAGAGPWLFGELGIADVFYAPVALRFLSYGIRLSAPAQSYVDAVATLPAVAEWCRDAAAETESLAFIDELTPVGKTPLKPG